MARNQRWYQVQGSFRAGVLSPTVQDSPEDKAGAEGAARLENFLVRRDGGLIGRPGFVRGAVNRMIPRTTRRDIQGPVIPSPRFGLLAGQEWRTDYPANRVDDFAGETADLTQAGRTFPADLYTRPGGIARLERVFTLEGGDSIDLTDNLIEIDLATGTPRALTLHGVQLVQGHWQSDNAAGDGHEMTLAASVVRRDGSTHNTIITPSDDPFVRGQFTPGIIPRDLVVPLVPATPGQILPAPVDVTQFRLRVASPRASLPLTLAIQGVSCFSVDPASRDGNPSHADDPGRPNVELTQDVFGDPYRILPWYVTDNVFVLVLGMEWVGYYARETGSSPCSAKEARTSGRSRNASSAS